MQPPAPQPQQSPKIYDDAIHVYESLVKEFADDLLEASRIIYRAPRRTRNEELALSLGGAGIALGGGAMFAILLGTAINWFAFAAAAAIAVLGLVSLVWGYRRS